MDATSISGNIIGALIAGIIGLVAAVYAQQLRSKTLKKNMSRAFLCEIDELESFISPIIIIWKEWTTGHEGVESQIHHARIGFTRLLNDKYIGDSVLKRNSIYDPNGEYFVYRKEISYFDEVLFKNIIDFYSQLKKSQYNYQELIKPNRLYSEYEEDLIAYDFFTHLKNAYDLIPILKTKLKEQN